MNERLKIKLFDTNFEHHGPKSSVSQFPGGGILEPTYIEWIRDPNKYEEISFFTDNCIDKIKICESVWKLYSKYNFAWIIEPRALVPSVYEQISNPALYNKFDKILTHDSELLKLDPDKFIPCPLFGAWVSLEDSANYWPKTENICIIASNKNQLPGHKLRHEIISKFADKYNIHVYGNVYKPFDKAVDILKKYRYCLVVENVSDGYWITEKLITPMLCGCVPIYYGSPLVREYFPGTAIFNNIPELENLLYSLTKENYEHMVKLADIYYQWNLAIKYRILEDWIYENILKGKYCD